MTVKENKPILTIVMAVLNGEKYIADALESIRNEKQYLSIELIVVDAVSKDKTLEVLKQYPDVVDILISEPDNGQSSAYNKAFKIARGAYFMWLCSDDVLIRDSFKNLREVLNSGMHKWIAFNTVILSSNKVPMKFLSGIKPPNFFPKKIHHFVDSPSSIFHRSVYKKIGPVDESLHYVMDLDYWYRIIESGISFVRYNEYVYGFRMHSDSKTGSLGYRLRESNNIGSLARDSESKFIENKYKLSSHCFMCVLVVKILKLRLSLISDLYNTYRNKNEL